MSLALYVARGTGVHTRVGWSDVLHMGKTVEKRQHLLHVMYGYVYHCRWGIHFFIIRVANLGTEPYNEDETRLF